VLVDPTSDPSTWEEAEAWRASQELYGSPGRADPGQTMTGERLPGDANADADYNVSDAIFLLDHLFSGRGRLPCGDGAVSAAGNRQLLDGNGDAVVDASDVVHTLHYLFLSGAPHAQGTACRATVDCAELCGP
jgi:hypothetical protein